MLSWRGDKMREEECALMQEPVLTRAPSHFVRVKCGHVLINLYISIANYYTY
jgi:hypothetical protein